MSQSLRSVVFIDANITDLSHLISGIKPGVAVSVLTDDTSGIDQITSYLGKHSADIVHIVSHGAPGSLHLGNGELNLENLSHYAPALSTWFAQAKSPSLLLYGCNVAAGDAGEEFLQKLHQLTGAGIAASCQVIGQGYWSLEVSPTHTTAPAPFSDTVLATWAGTLPISISNLSNSSYTEQGPAYVLDNDITFSGGTNYKNGYLEFSLSTATSSDFLTLATDGSPATGNGQVSIVGNAVYLGNGTTASVIGNVDSTFDGQNGQKLRINLSAGFENGDFDTGTSGSTVITGWTGVNQQVKFGVDTIAGLPTPIDTTFPTNNTDQGLNTPQDPGTFSTVLSDIQNDGGGNSVELRSSGITTQGGYDIVRGPYIYSNSTVQLSVGDTVSFEWQAEGGDDAYDVYGYIVEVNTGNIITILNETGIDDTASSPWQTETVNITQAGEYRFVFVAGTFDFTGGQAAGAQLYIDDVTVTQAVPPPSPNDSVLSVIAQKVQYNNTSDNPELSKTLTVSTQNSIGETASSTSTISITRVNDPVTGSVTISGTAEQGSTLSASDTLADADGLGAITYTWFADGTSTGITGATYTLGQADVGKVFTVQASYTDGGGTTESVTSSGTSAVANVNDPPTGAVTITGTTTIGSTLTADISSLADADGLGTSFTYRWEISTSGSSWTTIDGATSSTYTLLPEDVNKKVRVVVSYEDGGGTTESVTSTATGDVALTTPPGARSATSVDGEVFLGGNFIELGISTLGDFGTLGNKPEDFFGTDVRGAIGMSADFDGFGQGNDFRTDYFLPGGPEERWVLGYQSEGSTVTASNSARAGSTGSIVMEGVTDTSSGDTLSANIKASLNDALKVDKVVRYGVNDKFFATIITLTNTSAGALDSVRYMRSFDPDNTVDVGGQFDTINTVIATFAEDGIAAVEAKTLGAGDPIFDATGLTSPVVLFSTDARAKASYFGFRNTDPYAAEAYETPPEKGVSNTADIGITMTFDVGTLAAGASTSFVYYTSLDGRSFDDILADGLPPTGVVTVSGDLTQGKTVTADTSNLADFDGLPDPSTFTYQWQQSIDGINWVDIVGATNISLDLRNDQVGKFLRYTVSYVDGKGTTETMVGISTTSVAEKFDATNDFNGDGSVDIFWQQQSSGDAVFWLMDNVILSDGGFLTPSVGSPDWKIQAVGDLDGDGGPDLVWRHQFSYETAVWLMDSTTLESGALLPNDAGPLWQIADAADFNGDGKDDILWRHATAGQLAVWYMDGVTRTGGELLNTPVFTETAWSVVAAGDFSGDGDVEIVWQHNTSGQVAEWNMSGIDFVDGSIIATYDPGWTIQGAADFNQDGNLDLLWANIASGESSVWFMSGTSFTGSGVALPSVDPGWVSIV